MGIYLPAPEHKPRATALRIESMWMDECALRPTSWQTLWIAQTDTRRATYGNFGPCGNKGACDSCPVYANVSRAPRDMRPFSAGHDKLIARPDRNRPGWVDVYQNPDYATSDHWAWWWTFEDLARVPGWVVGRAFHDEYGEAFELVRG